MVMNYQKGSSGQCHLMTFTVGIILIVLIVLILFSPLPIHALDYKAQTQLGKQLFYDVRLSRNKQMSCATCHKPDLFFIDGLPKARGLNNKVLTRNTPTLLHVADHHSFFWDGRASSLETQILEMIQNPDIMNMDLESLVKRLNQIPGYVAQFKKIYGQPVTSREITRSIAAYERTLVTKRSPFDKHLAGDKTAISPPAQQGLELFQGRANCALCHHGLNFTDSGFHNIGVPSSVKQKVSGRFSLKKLLIDSDTGRYKVTGRPEDLSSFKTPTLRNITQTAPYMHNGVFETLEEVIEFYDMGGIKNPNLDIQMKQLGLTAQEKFYLIEFLKTLTGKPPSDIEKPELP